MERRYETGFNTEGTDEPGLVINNDNLVEVILADGSRKALDAALDTNPVTLTAIFAGAGADVEVVAPVMLAPYDQGRITAVHYMLNEELSIVGSEARTWTLEDADANVLYELTLDESTFGTAPAPAGTVLVLNLFDVDGAHVSNLQPLFFRSSATDGPADPGGLLAISFVDPPPVELATVNFDYGELGINDVDPPSISVVSPDRAGPGASISIFGATLSGAQVVRFGSYGANFGVISDSLIRAYVPDIGIGPGAQLVVQIEVVGPTGKVGISPGNFTMLPGDGGGGGGDTFQAALAGGALALAPETAGLSEVVVGLATVTFAVVVHRVSLKSRIFQGDASGGSKEFDFTTGASTVFQAQSWDGTPIPYTPGGKAIPIGFEHELNWSYKGGVFRKVFKGTAALAAAIAAFEAIPEYAKKKDDKIGYRFYVTPCKIVAGRMESTAVLQTYNGAKIVTANFATCEMRWGILGTLQVDCAHSFAGGTEHSVTMRRAQREAFGLAELKHWRSRANGSAVILDKNLHEHTVTLDTPSKFIPADISVYKNKGKHEPDGPGFGTCIVL